MPNNLISNSFSKQKICIRIKIRTFSLEQKYLLPIQFRTDKTMDFLNFRNIVFKSFEAGCLFFETKEQKVFGQLSSSSRPEKQKNKEVR